MPRRRCTLLDITENLRSCNHGLEWMQMSLTRPEAATLALLACGGQRDSVHTEDVAIKASELAPGMFGWEKHPDRIDKELVRVALSDARLKKRFTLGSHDQGWMLTPVGLAWARHQPSVGEGSVAVVRRRGKEDAQLHRERGRMVGTVAFEKFAEGKADLISSDDADAFFRLNVYVRGQARQRKIARIENEFGNDPQLGELIGQLAEKARNRESR